MERKRLTRLTRIYAPPGLDWPRTFVWFGTREIENTFSWAKTDWQTRKTEKHSPADLRAVAVAAELGAVWECHSALSPWTYHKPSNPKVCWLSFAILCLSTALQLMLQVWEATSNVRGHCVVHRCDCAMKHERLKRPNYSGCCRCIFFLTTVLSPTMKCVSRLQGPSNQQHPIGFKCHILNLADCRLPF